MPKLLLATNNAGKVAEYRILLRSCGWEIVTPRDVGIGQPPEESGETYEENARMKALHGAQSSGLVTLADDSGLEIKAMDGAPGPASARFLGDDVSYEERFAEIQRRLKGLSEEKRWARFVCVVAVAEPGTDRVRLAWGEVQGFIAEEPRGEGSGNVIEYEVG
jgi:XTP/dITP diphosphohydrolase